MTTKNSTLKIRQLKSGRGWEVFGKDPQGKAVKKLRKTEAAAESLKTELTAKWELGLREHQEAKTSHVAGLGMLWADFSEYYLHQKPSKDNASRLALAARILEAEGVVGEQPTVGEIMDELATLQDGFRNGTCSKFTPARPRSSSTVHSHMRTVLAALEWGRKDGLWEKFAAVNLQPAEDSAKGEALTEAQFATMKKAAAKVLGKDHAREWVAVMDCMANTGLRLTECHRLTWDTPTEIDPANPPIQVIIETRGGKRRGKLRFFQGSQKSKRVEDTPLLALAVRQFDARENKSGPVFDPQPLEVAVHGKRRRAPGRMTAERWGKIMSKIGEAAKIEVAPATYRVGKNGRRVKVPAKFASAHDLRRTFGQRLVDARVPEELASKMMRHKDVSTTRKFYANANAELVGEQCDELLEAAGVA